MRVQARERSKMNKTKLTESGDDNKRQDETWRVMDGHLPADEIGQAMNEPT